MSGYSSWLGMQHQIPDRSRIYGSSRTWLVSKTSCLQNGRSPYTEKCGINTNAATRNAFRQMNAAFWQRGLEILIASPNCGLLRIVRRVVPALHFYVCCRAGSSACLLARHGLRAPWILARRPMYFSRMGTTTYLNPLVSQRGSIVHQQLIETQ